MPHKPVPPYMRILGERVHSLRRKGRQSQATLAVATQMSSTTLSNIEQGKAPTITVEHLMALVHALHTTPNILLGVERYELDGPDT